VFKGKSGGFHIVGSNNKHCRLSRIEDYDFHNSIPGKLFQHSEIEADYFAIINRQKMPKKVLTVAEETFASLGKMRCF
jgi:hypothetical protein